MVGKFRELARSMGFDITRFPGAAGHWPRLAEMLDRHKVTLVFDVGAHIGQYAAALRNSGIELLQTVLVQLPEIHRCYACLPSGEGS